MENATHHTDLIRPYTLSRISEILFFEQAYSSRKFLIDDNVSFVPPNYLQFFSDLSFIHKKTDWKDAQKILSKFLDKQSSAISIATLFTSFITLDLSHGLDINKLLGRINCSDFMANNKNAYENSTILDRIKQIQDQFLDNIRTDRFQELSTSDFSIDNTWQYTHISNVTEIDYAIYFFIVSCNYGVYFANLIIQPDINDIIEQYYNKLYMNQKYFLLHPVNIPHPTYETLFNNNEKYNTSELKAFEFIKFMSSKKIIPYFDDANIIIDDKYIKSFYSQISKYIDHPYSTSSAEGRLLGLWIWDHVKSPTKKNEKKLASAIKLLRQRYPSKLTKRGDNFDKLLERYYRWTDKCITHGKILKFSPSGGQPKPAAQDNQ